MTFRERCSCGAEFEVSGKPKSDPEFRLGVWRERHEKVCSAVRQIVGELQAYAVHQGDAYSKQTGGATVHHPEQ